MKRGNKVAQPARDAAEPVSELTTNRLSVYLRCLNALDAGGVRTVSSQALAEQFHLNAAQIRKDLAHFGEFGVRGVGYYVKDLRRHLRQILGLDRRVRVAIMGAGNLGLALADYAGFRDEGFEIAALFDTVQDEDRPAVAQRRADPRRPRSQAHRQARRHRHRRDRRAAPTSRRRWSTRSSPPACKAILNFSPGALNVPPDVKLKSVDLTVSLESLSFFLAQEGGQ